MGTTTKGIMLSGVYLMLGIFTLSFNSADGTNSRTAMREAQFAQAEQLARLGISVAAASKTFRETNLDTPYQHTITLNGNTLSYTIERISAITPQKARITSTVDVKETKNVNGILTEVVVGKVTVIGNYIYPSGSGRWRFTGMQTKYENL